MLVASDMYGGALIVVNSRQGHTASATVRHMHRPLWGTGTGLMAVSLLVALFLSSVDPLWAEQHVTLLVAFGWAQQAALLLGAALIAAGLVVARLAPPPLAQHGARSQPSANWFA